MTTQRTSCQYQEQIQSLYFSQAQASIHVTILQCHGRVVRDLNNPEIVIEDLFISHQVKHDNDSVHECPAIVADYLKEINCSITIMHE